MSLVKLKFSIITLFIYLITKDGYCSPLIPSVINGPIDSDIWSFVDRRPGLPDVVIPSLCPSPCLNLFKAQPVNISGVDCACRCSPSTPVFVQSFGHCSNQIDECEHPIRFQGNIDSSVPLFTLPTPQSVIFPTASLKWEESNVKLIPSIGVRCNLTAVYYLKDDRIWQEATPKLFFINWSNNEPKIFWNGTTNDAKHFEGTVIQIKLDCFGNQKNGHCVSFRIAGQTGPLISLKSRQSADNHQGRLETIVIILLAILLFLSIFGSIILWHVCWGLKKSELISSIQMHILYQMKQDKEKESNETYHKYQSINKNSNNQMAQNANNETDINSDVSQSVVVKRKLFFSAEFFEPHFMMNPPPMAEQFLHDLRKMIEIAKQRIHLRRHVPQLVSIPEESKEHYQPYMELEDRQNALQVLPPEEFNKQERNEESSPKSIKSSDSGRESMKDASSTESVASSTDSNPRKLRSPLPSLPKGGVKNLVNDFEAVKPSEIPLKKTPSRIPVINNLAKSPRLPVKSANISAIKSNNPFEPPPLPPRNFHQISDVPPPIPTSPIPVRNKDGIVVTTNNNNGRRKTYAVFPTDPMLKKSLPRRTKKKPPSPVNSVIETNM